MHVSAAPTFRSTETLMHYPFHGNTSGVTKVETVAAQTRYSWGGECKRAIFCE